VAIAAADAEAALLLVRGRASGLAPGGTFTDVRGLRIDPSPAAAAAAGSGGVRRPGSEGRGETDGKPSDELPPDRGCFSPGLEARSTRPVMDCENRFMEATVGGGPAPAPVLRRGELARGLGASVPPPRPERRALAERP
jgi:hypothetical protein